MLIAIETCVLRKQFHGSSFEGQIGLTSRVCRQVFLVMNKIATIAVLYTTI